MSRVYIRGCGAQAICSYVFWPLPFLSGVNILDCHKVAGLLGAKTFLDPFIAYQKLSVFINNRRDLLSHVADNGTWYWSGDDVILRTTGAEDTVLANGIIAVLNYSAYMMSCTHVDRHASLSPVHTGVQVEFDASVDGTLYTLK